MDNNNNKSDNNTNTNILQQLRSLNESNWKNLAEISEGLDDKDKAIFCYENAINNNPSKIQILNKLASIYQEEDKYEEAIKYLKRIIQANSSDFDAWSNLGHCYLMMEDFKKAQSSYQQASQFPNSNNDPNLLYGIGILYARLNNLEHAQQLFEKVIQINETTNKFEKINELCFRLGIVHKQKGNYDEAMRYFQMIGDNPPVPLSIDDIKFQKGHIYELQKNITKAKEIYDEILINNPTNAKAHQQIGWLYYHNPQLNPQSNTIAIKHLTEAINIDSTDAQTWYLLGRCQIANKEFNRAYEAYQQAVERDGTNPAFWCSIGVLFYQINQYNDALNAYTKAIELDPNFSEVWYDLGTLYESCHQIDDSLGAYQKASELDPSNIHIRQRLAYLRKKYENKDGNDMQDVSNGNYVVENGTNIPNSTYPIENNNNGTLVNNTQYIENNNSNGNINNNNVISNNNVNTNYHSVDNINNTSIDKKRKLEKDTPSGYNSKKLKDGDEAYNPKDDFSESTESSETQPQNNTTSQYNTSTDPQHNYYNQNQNLPQYPHNTSYDPQYNTTHPNQQYGNDPQYNQTYPQQPIYEHQVDPNAQQHPPTYNPSYNNVPPSENSQYIYTPTKPDPQQNQDSSNNNNSNNNVPPPTSDQVPPSSDSSSSVVVSPSQPVNNVTPPSTSTEVSSSDNVPVPSTDSNPPPSTTTDVKVENKEPTTTPTTTGTSPPNSTTTTTSPEKNSSEGGSNSVPPSDSQPEPPPTSSDPPTVKVESENQN